MNHRPGVRLSAGSHTVLPTVRFSPATSVEFTPAANTGVVDENPVAGPSGSGSQTMAMAPEFRSSHALKFSCSRITAAPVICWIAPGLLREPSRLPPAGWPELLDRGTLRVGAWDLLHEPNTTLAHLTEHCCVLHVHTSDTTRLGSGQTSSAARFLPRALHASDGARLSSLASVCMSCARRCRVCDSCRVQS